MPKQLSLIETAIAPKRLDIQSNSKGYRLHFDHPHGKLYQGDAIDWLSSLDSESVVEWIEYDRKTAERREKIRSKAECLH